MCNYNSHGKLERISADGMEEVLENVIWEVLSVIEIGEVLNEVVEWHLLANILPTHAVTQLHPGLPDTRPFTAFLTDHQKLILVDFQETFRPQSGKIWDVFEPLNTVSVPLALYCRFTQLPGRAVRCFLPVIQYTNITGDMLRQASRICGVFKPLNTCHCRFTRITGQGC